MFRFSSLLRLTVGAAAYEYASLLISCDFRRLIMFATPLFILLFWPQQNAGLNLKEIGGDGRCGIGGAKYSSVTQIKLCNELRDTALEWAYSSSDFSNNFTILMKVASADRTVAAPGLYVIAAAVIAG
jgi:hypothetical protein